MSAELHFRDGDCMEYEQVRLLDNGWVKATEHSGGNDYFPSDVIELVTGKRVYVGDANAV